MSQIIGVTWCNLFAAVLRKPRIKERSDLQQISGRNSRLKLLTACCGNMRYRVQVSPTRCVSSSCVYSNCLPDTCHGHTGCICERYVEEILGWNVWNWSVREWRFLTLSGYVPTLLLPRCHLLATIGQKLKLPRSKRFTVCQNSGIIAGRLLLKVEYTGQWQSHTGSPHLTGCSSPSATVSLKRDLVQRQMALS